MEATTLRQDGVALSWRDWEVPQPSWRVANLPYHHVCWSFIAGGRDGGNHPEAGWCGTVLTWCKRPSHCGSGGWRLSLQQLFLSSSQCWPWKKQKVAFWEGKCKRGNSKENYVAVSVCVAIHWIAVRTVRVGNALLCSQTYIVQSIHVVHQFVILNSSSPGSIS